SDTGQIKRTFAENIPDSLINPEDSLKQNKVKSIVFAPDSLTEALTYSAKDSMIYDLSKKIIYLYGSAQVFYESYELKAGYIEFNFNTFIATAEGITDSTGRVREEPFFNDGNQTFNAR